MTNRCQKGEIKTKGTKKAIFMLRQIDTNDESLMTTYCKHQQRTEAFHNWVYYTFDNLHHNFVV